MVPWTTILERRKVMNEDDVTWGQLEVRETVDRLEVARAWENGLPGPWGGGGAGVRIDG